MSSPMPHDEDVERALLGGIHIARADQRGPVFDALVPSDFYTPLHAAVFVAFGEMHRRGDVVNDVVMLRDELGRTGTKVDAVELIALLDGGTAWNLPAYVDTLTRLSVARAVVGAAVEVLNAAQAAVVEPDVLVEQAREAFAGIDLPLTNPDALTGLSTVDEFLEQAKIEPAPWVIPGMLRKGWRCLMVAPEGVGKSVAFRQVAGAAAQGIHPFAHTPIPPVRTLVIDLENPDDAIEETMRPIRDMSARAQGYDPSRFHLWRRPDGVDLRARADRAAFHRVLETVRPDLVCLGPLYKAYRPERGESDESAAAQVQVILDDARTRHGFALLMEHHAPKANGLSGRELVPYGSSLWLRWPELGLKLIPGDGDRMPETSLKVGRFRRDRMKNAWPDRLDRGPVGAWPWQGWWREGMDELAAVVA